MKKCTVCKELLDYSNYHNSKKSNDGYSYRCKVCDRAARADYRKRNRARFAYISKVKQLKFIYGISIEDYISIMDEQRGCCAICGDSLIFPAGSEKYRFALDHCHKTKKVRGLLCLQCNCVLGQSFDSIDILEKAVQYLKKHEEDGGD